MEKYLNRVKVVTCSLEKFPEDTLLYKSISRSFDDVLEDIEVDFVGKNEDSIASVYNKKIDEHKHCKYILFCHDDISIEDNNLHNKIERAIGDESEYAICGLAGLQQCKITRNNLWHLMAPSGQSFDGASGAVAHYTGKDDTECFMSNFGPMPKRVILMDGLFLAVNVKKIREVGLTFDESYPSKWNFYDLDFCLTANKLGLKMTTWPIWTIHKSHGLNSLEDDDWRKGNDYFINKWGKGE